MDKIELERLFELFDKALTSTDERVVNALRSLLMIAELTDMGDPTDETASQWPRRTLGPMRQLLDRVGRLEQEVRNLTFSKEYQYNFNDPGYSLGTYGAVPSNPGHSHNIRDLTLSGINYSTYAATMAAVPPSITIDTTTLSDSDLDDILKGTK